MAVTLNAKGTSVSSFTIGKGGQAITLNANGYLTIDDGVDTEQPIGYNTIPIYEIDAADTFDLAHAGMMWHKDAGGAVTFTCDNDSTIPQGSTWIVHNDDAEDITIAEGTGVTIAFLASGAAPATGDVTVSQGGVVTVYKYTDTEYWVWGDDGPFNILTAGSTTDSTLRWNGSAWAENTTITATSTGVITAASTAGNHTFSVDSATTNADIPVLKLSATSTGTPAAGIGPSIQFESETAAGAPGNLEIGGEIALEATDVTATTEDFDFVFNTMAAGAAAAERFRISSGGSSLATNLTLTGSNRLILPQVAGAQANPTLAFGDGDSGFYEQGDDNVRMSLAATASWEFTTGVINGLVTGAAAIRNEAATNTNPTLTPYRSDSDTGIGGDGADQLSLIAGGVELIRATETGTATTDQVTIAPGVTLRGAAATPSLAFGDGDTGFYESADDTLKFTAAGADAGTLTTSLTWNGTIQTSLGGRMPNEAASATNPNFVPTAADLDTGIGANAADQLSLIAGGVEMMRLVEDTEDYILSNTPILIAESANAVADVAGYGQYWVGNDNNPYFTPDDGTDYNLLTAYQSGIVGDLTNASSGTFAVPTTVDNTIEFMSLARSSGAHSGILHCTVSESGFSVAKTYVFSLQYNQTGTGVWETLVPTDNTGRYSSQDFSIEVEVVNTTATFRCRRTAGTTVGDLGWEVWVGQDDDALTIGTPSTTSTSAVTAFINPLSVWDITGNDNVKFTHDGTDLNVVGTNTTDINMTSGITAVNMPAITLTTALDETYGGTGQTTYTQGDVLYASAANVLSKLPIGSAGTFLRSNASTVEWSGVSFANSATTGDIIYASGTNNYDNLAGVATGNALISGGVGTAPSWGKIALTTHVSGVLPEANGGTNQSTYTTGDLLYSDAANSLAKLALGNVGEVLTVVGSNVAWNPPAVIEFAYDSTVTAADPGAGTIRFDSVTIGSIANAYIDDLDASGDNAEWILSNLADGDILTFRSITDPLDYIIASVNGSTTDGTGYWTVPLTLIHTGTIFTNGDQMRVSVEWAGSNASVSGFISGTVANNQIVTGTGASTVDSSANLTYDGTTLTMAGAGAQLLLPIENDAVTPTLGFGDGDTGFYENSDDVFRLAIAGSALYQFDSTHITGTTSASFYLRNTTVSAVNPSLGPRRDTNTGIGSAENDSMSLIAGGVEMMRFDSTVGGQDHIKTEVPFYMDERTAALTDYANYGQLWVRNDAPNTLMYTDDAGNDFTANNVFEIAYVYSSAVTSTDPGAGTLNFNSVTIGSITTVYIDDLDDTGRDNSYMLSTLADGDLLEFRSASDPADYIVATVNGAPTDSTGFWTISLTLVNTGTIFTNNDQIRIIPTFLSQAAGSGGTVTSVDITAGTLIDKTGGPITTSGSITIDVDLSEATEAVYAPATDYLLFLDGGVTGTAAKESGADFATALAGTGIGASSGTLTADLGEVTAVVFDPATDYIPIIDGSATGPTQKDQWADIAALIAGTGLTASAGVINRDTISLTADVSGILPEANGGTNQSTYAQGDILYASAANTLSKLTAGSDGQVLTLASGVPSWAAAGGGNSQILADTFTFSTTISTPPGNNEIRYNSGTLASVSQMYVDDDALSGNDFGLIAAQLSEGDRIIIASETDATVFNEFVCTGTITDNTGYWSIQVDYISGTGTLPTNAATIRFEAYFTMLDAGTSTGNAHDIPVWTGDRWQASGSNIRISDANPPVGGRIVSQGAASTDITRPAGMYYNVGNSVTGLWFAQEATSADGFYSFADYNGSPEWVEWGSRQSSVNQRIFYMDDNNAFVVDNDASFMIEEKAAANADVATRGQIWVRDDAPNVLMYTDDAGNDFTAQNVHQIEYEFDATTTAADPGAGLIRFDNATIGSITNAYIDDVDNTARDNSYMLANLGDGDVISFKSVSDPADYIVASVNGTPTDNTGYWTVPLTLIHTGTLFTAADVMHISIEWAGSQGGSGTVTSSTGADNRIAVFTTATNIEGDASLTWDASTATLSLFDTGDTDSLTMQHDGTNFNSVFTNTAVWDISGATNIDVTGGTDVRIRDGANFQIYDSDDSDYIDISHSGGTTPNRVLTFNAVNTDYIDFTNIVSPGGVRIRDGAQLEIYDSTDTNYLVVNHDGTDVNWTGVNTTDFIVDGLTWFKMLAGGGMALYDSTNADEGNFSHDGTDFNTNFVGTTDWNISGQTGDLVIDSGTFLLEQASANADKATYGQIWVKNDTPNNLYFTDDAGTDYALTGPESPQGDTATVQTTTASQTEILAYAVASGTSVGFEALIMGREDATGDTVLEKIRGLISNEAGTTAMIDTPGVDRHESAGATAWVVTVAADDTADTLTFDVTGEASHTIDWKIKLEVIVI